ncbi:sialidase family protein [Cytobacillus firmus]|uniref:sialidase family protein n=1 Tax=Cytobacillus firmus TaxID=1399 RepID=UPI0018CEA8A2|nr:sialidase family protein [Cytobacillus firmus]
MGKKVWIAVVSCAMLLSICFTGQSAFADSFKPVVKVKNQTIENGYFTNLNDKADTLNTLDQGTIIVRFQQTGTSIMSLFSLSNNTVNDGHFHLYVSPSGVGSENRFEKPGETKSNTHISASVPVKANEIHTLAMVVDQDQGYKYFLDGKLIKEDTTSPRKFLSDIYNPNSAQLGQTERASGNTYPFKGNIDFVKIYNEPLSNEFLTAVTGETKAEPLFNPLPETALISDPKSLFYPGFMDSNNYRIPALYSTEKGTLIAGIDRRVVHGGDSPNNIDAAIRRSFDSGKTWEQDGIMINDYPDQASNIDLTFVQDRSNDRIFALVDGFPNGAGLMGGFGNNAYEGTGFKTIDGKKYLYLLDKENNEYTVREDGRVYDASGQVTAYSVDEKRNLYENGQKIDNYFSSTSPLKAYKTSYLELYYSDDEGESWTGPIDLNDETKEEWMIFLGTGPGNGIQLDNGPHAGRLVFPVYFLNENKKQASAVIYSDDHGQTWKRGESPNEGRDVGNGQTINEKSFTNSAHEITESQVVEMPDGQLKLFMRNFSGYAQVATSFDGGETWHPEVITETALVAPYSQMSAIRYNGQIDGKEAVIFSSANDSSSRINGTVRVGLIEENGKYENGRTKYSFNWKYQQLIKEGHYGYSSLAQLSDGNIGLFYEGTSNTNMDFIRFNTDFLKWDKYLESPDPQITSFEVIPNQKDKYRKKDKIKVEVGFDGYTMLMGAKRLHGKLGDFDVSFDLVEEKGTDRFIFESSVPKKLKKGTYTISLNFDDSLSVYNVYGNEFPKGSEQDTLTNQIIVK